MKPLRRTVNPNVGGMLFLDLQEVCDQCNKYRAHGNHKKCSRRRQMINQKKREAQHEQA